MQLGVTDTPKPILAMSWKPAEGEERCKHARPGVIVLGEGRNTFLHVCIAKKACEKHWPRASQRVVPTKADRKAEEARRRQDAELERRRLEGERWRSEVRPRAMRVLAECAANMQWSRMLLRLVLEELQIDDAVIAAVGKPEALPARRYPQAIAVALARRHSWQRDTFLSFTKRLGVKVTAKAFADLAEPKSSDAVTAKGRHQKPDQAPKET